MSLVRQQEAPSQQAVLQSHRQYGQSQLWHVKASHLALWFPQDVQQQGSSAASAAEVKQPVRHGQCAVDVKAEPHERALHESKQPVPHGQHAADVKAEPHDRKLHKSVASADPSSQQQPSQQKVMWEVKLSTSGHLVDTECA